MPRTLEELDDAVAALEVATAAITRRIQSIDRAIIDIGDSERAVVAAVKRVRRQINSTQPQTPPAERTEKKLIRGKVVTRAKGR